MMKSFTFNCDDFVPDERGGTFICGRRKFALVMSSSELSIQILRHVKEKSSFTEAEYPSSVISALLQEGLLRQQGDQSLWGRLSTLTYSIQMKWRHFLKRNGRRLASDPMAILVLLNIRSRISWMFSNQPVTLLKAELTNTIVKTWAWLLHPMSIAIIALMNIVWIVTNYQVRDLKAVGIAFHTSPNPLLIILLLIIFLIIHELAHASSAYNRLGKCGEIRIRRYLYIFPYLSAHLPDIGTCRPFERVAISASGPVIQISSAILLISIQPNSIAVRHACELSIILGLINLIPLKNSDGYWILVEMLGGQKPRFTINWTSARKINIFYTMGITLLITILATLIFSMI